MSLYIESYQTWQFGSLPTSGAHLQFFPNSEDDRPPSGLYLILFAIKLSRTCSTTCARANANGCIERLSNGLGCNPETHRLWRLLLPKSAPMEVSSAKNGLNQNEKPLSASPIDPLLLHRPLNLQMPKPPSSSTLRAGTAPCRLCPARLSGPLISIDP